MYAKKGRISSSVVNFCHIFIVIDVKYKMTI